MSSFVTSPKGITHMFLIPASVTTTLNQHPISIDCSTTYPFGNTLSYTISSTTSFDFSIRIPDWATSASTIEFGNHGHKIPLRTSSTKSLYTIPVKKGVTEVEVTLQAEIRTVPRGNNTVAIYHGALLYALDIAYTSTTHPALNWTDRTPLPESPAHDHFLTPTSNSSWKVAIDPSQLQFRSSGPGGWATSTNDRGGKGAELKNPIFARGAPPTVIWAAATGIEWAETEGTAGLPPKEVVKVGKPYWVRLVPYGSAKLHMGELPVVGLEKLNVRDIKN
jgi:hypothetical protein